MSAGEARPIVAYGEALLSEPGSAPTDLDIITILWDAYADDEKPRFVELIDSFLDDAAALGTQLRSRQPGSKAYIDSRDWLSMQPEVSSILERATHRESLLLDALALSEHSGTDFWSRAWALDWLGRQNLAGLGIRMLSQKETTAVLEVVKHRAS